MVCYSEDTIERCIHDYDAGDLEGLIHQPGGGRAPKVPPPKYIQLLLKTADQDPPDLGVEFSNWTAQRLADYLAGRTGIKVDESRVRHYLHANGYRLLHPVLTVSSPDPEYEEAKVAPGLSVQDRLH